MDTALLISSAVPTLQILLMGTAGAVMGRKGILDSGGRQTLSQLIFCVFMPCLTFSKLAQSVNLGNLVMWWFLPVNILVSIMLGFCLGWLAVTVLRPPVWLRPHIMCATAIGNVGNLPMILVTALCKDSNWPFQAVLPPGQCTDRGVAYIAFGRWIAGLVLFTVAYNMLDVQQDNSFIPLHSELAELHQPPTSTLLPQQDGLPPPPHSTQAYNNDGHSTLPYVRRHIPGDRSPSPNLLALTRGSHNGPNAVHCEMTLPHEATSSGLGMPLLNGVHNEENMERSAGEGDRLVRVDVESASRQPECSTWYDGDGRRRAAGGAWEGEESGRGLAHIQVRGAWQTLIRWCPNVPWSSVFNPPTVSASAGIAIGCMPAVKDLFFGDNDPPLRLVGDGISMMGDAMIPSTMLLLGAVLHQGPTSSQLAARVILGVAFFRLLLMPLLGLGVVMGLHAKGVFHAPDALFKLVLLVSHSMPTAMQLGTVATLRKSGEAEVSALLFWQYIACLVTLPLALAVQRHLL